MHGFHFFKALQRRRFGTRDKAFITGRGEIAFGQAAIIMSRADDPVKISLAAYHVMPFIGKFSGASATWLAMGQAQKSAA